MIKNITKLEHKIGERTYQFLCDNDSPLGECHDAISKFKSYVVELIKSKDEAQEPKEEKVE
jgi:hypothetical protein